MSEIRIRETNVLHAADVIYWLDGGTATANADMSRLSRTVSLELTTRPVDLQLAHRAGRTALWRRPTGPMIDGKATENDKKFPSPAPTFTVAGTVRDPEGYYNPRAFSVVAGTTGAHELSWYPNGHMVVLYPTPFGTRLNNGGLNGTLRWITTETVVPWAILKLTVTISPGVTMDFFAQANDEGDFILSLNRLPLLPESIDHYSATLGIRALASASPQTPIDPDTLVSMTLGDPASAAFSAGIALQVVPGEMRSMRSFEKDFLTVQPSSP